MGFESRLWQEVEQTPEPEKPENEPTYKEQLPEVPGVIRRARLTITRGRPTTAEIIYPDKPPTDSE